ncbi:MAG: polyketide synthase [Caldilineaceae bacterium]
MEQITAAVVDWARFANGVSEITLHDTATRNGFSAGILAGWKDSLWRVAQDEQTKVVILTGYGNYFLSGGTKEELQQLQSGDRSTDFALDLIHPLIDCPLPVIAAMQGHGIGAGFVLGLHADLIVLARESIYTTNFLKYGFTPGMGATQVVPAKLGPGLGHEMLFSARNYQGGELAQRGIACPVLPRAEVLPYARQLAQEIAMAPRSALVNLKQLLSAPWRPTFDDKVTREMAVLASTMQQPEVARRIESRFGQ